MRTSSRSREACADLPHLRRIGESKKASLKKLVASGGDGVHRAMSKASGTSARDSSRFVGDSATLKWRGHDLKFNGRAEVAAGVSKFILISSLSLVISSLASSNICLPFNVTPPGRTIPSNLIRFDPH